MKFPNITVEYLKQEFGQQIEESSIDDKKLIRIVNLIRKAESNGREDVDIALEYFSQVFGLYGVEVIQGYDIEPADAEYYLYNADRTQTINLIFANTGETYYKTLAYDTEHEEFLVTSWGDWVEEAESSGIKSENDYDYDEKKLRLDDDDVMEEEFNRQFIQSYDEFLKEEDAMKRDLINDDAFRKIL
jgi:hypothetical protein